MSLTPRSSLPFRFSDNFACIFHFSHMHYITCSTHITLQFVHCKDSDKEQDKTTLIKIILKNLTTTPKKQTEHIPTTSTSQLKTSHNSGKIMHPFWLSNTTVQAHFKEETNQKKVLHMKIKVKQPTGRPRSRWTQQVSKDVMQKGGREG